MKASSNLCSVACYRNLIISSYLFVVHFILFGESASVNFTDKQIIRTARQENCCGNLGCFDVTAAFIDLLKRPINPFPSCDTKVEFTLRTQSNVDRSQKLEYADMQSLKESRYSAEREGTKFIIHGFMDSSNNQWIQTMERKLLVEGDFNVIRVHWSNTGNVLTYFQAAADSRVVGSIVAKLIRALIALGQDYRTLHLIGHSLGAHIAGYAGEQVKIGRITGLDPAGLYFKDMPLSVRLDPTDADLVDTIITDGRLQDILKLGYGASQTMGHLNFFPNGGMNQPGCQQNILASLFKFTEQSESGVDFLGCSHFRSPLLFSDTIANPLSNCLAVECESYENYKKGRCFSCEAGRCINMGLNLGINATANYYGQPKSFFLDTNSAAPFCALPFRIVFGLNSDGSFSGSGFLRFQLHGNKRSSDWIQPLFESIQLSAGRSYTFVVSAPSNIGPIKAVSVEWKFDRSLLHIFDYFRTHKIRIRETLEITPLNEGTVYLRTTDKDIYEDTPARYELR